MALIPDFGVFIASVVLISMSGVLLPGPLFAVTIEKATKWKTAGALIALGHGVIEFPLMFLIYFILSQFVVPDSVQAAIGLIGGTFMIYMGVNSFRNRNKEQTAQGFSRDSLLAGVWTTAVNAGFILWWLTIGTELILNAEQFGFLGFATFAGVHWLCDFAWYSAFALAIYTSRRFWTNRIVRQGVALFCVGVFVGFGAYFFGSALWSVMGRFV